MAPALVPLMPAISSVSSSSRRSSTPQVKAPWEPPPCRARSISWRPPVERAGRRAAAGVRRVAMQSFLCVGAQALCSATGHGPRPRRAVPVWDNRLLIPAPHVHSHRYPRRFRCRCRRPAGGSTRPRSAGPGRVRPRGVARAGLSRAPRPARDGGADRAHAERRLARRRFGEWRGRFARARHRGGAGRHGCGQVGGLCVHRDPARAGAAEARGDFHRHRGAAGAVDCERPAGAGRGAARAVHLFARQGARALRLPPEAGPAQWRRCGQRRPV
ncbi:hypothetical protein D9M68_717060 [compost metagenome]